MILGQRQVSSEYSTTGLLLIPTIHRAMNGQFLAYLYHAGHAVKYRDYYEFLVYLYQAGHEDKYRLYYVFSFSLQ